MTTQTNPIEPGPIPETKPNHCPKCGADESQLSYDSFEVEDGIVRYPFTCIQCGFSGEEVHEMGFVGFWDEDGSQVGRAKAPEPKTVFVFVDMFQGIIDDVLIFDKKEDRDQYKADWLKEHDYENEEDHDNAVDSGADAYFECFDREVFLKAVTPV